MQDTACPNAALYCPSGLPFWGGPEKLVDKYAAKREPQLEW
jgi:hypothetical protein